jgi:hypothetical protein
MNRGTQFRAVTVGVLMALVCLPGKASAAQCGVLQPGFETLGWAYSSGQL